MTEPTPPAPQVCPSTNGSWSICELPLHHAGPHHDHMSGLSW